MTEEDEAFDEIARKQGHWGGGFMAKRAMAADKINSDFDEEYKKSHAELAKYRTEAQPAQEPVAWFRYEDGIRIYYETKAFDDCIPLYTTPPATQPAQEPVAWTLLLTGEHHGIIGEAGEKFIGAPECYQRVNVYTTPPKREWVGLTEEDFSAINQSCLTKLQAATSAESILKERNT